MATTDPPNASDQATMVGKELWSRGQSTGGSYSKRRVNQFDKIGSDDINQLRDGLEVLATHTHNYTDAVGGC